MSIRARLPNASRRRPSFAALLLGVLAICLQSGCATTPAEDSSLVRSKPDPANQTRDDAPGGIRVRVRSSNPNADSETATIVYLAVDRAESVSPLPEQVVEIGRRDDQLTPGFIVAVVRQGLSFRVVDDIHHHIFSKSEIGAFDLGALGAGESKRISFDNPGMLRLYCALHPSESAALYISPSPDFTRVTSGDEIVLSNLSPGSYELHAWTESKPLTVMEVEVRPGAISAVLLEDHAGGARK